MRRLKIAIIAVLIASVVLTSAFLYLEDGKRPIKAPSSEIVIILADLPPGWEEENRIEVGSDLPRDGAYWSTFVKFTNASIFVGRNLTLNVVSYDSVEKAHQEFLLRGGADYFQHSPLTMGDEGSLLFGRGLSPDPNGTVQEFDGTYTVVATHTEYLFRVGNIVVSVTFHTDGDAYEAREQWMDDIARSQEERIHH